jgi:glucose-1-phosphate adenylyltransferase
VLVLSGDHVYAMNYLPMIRFHRQNRFPATVAVTPMADRDSRQFGIVEVNAFDQVVGFQEKPESPRGDLASMGVYVFRRDILVRALLEDGGDPGSGHDFGKDIFPKLIRMVDVGAYTYDGYWQDIGTVEAFYDANMLFLEAEHREKLIRPGWPIRTPSVEAPPARLAGKGRARKSLIANGAVVRGDVNASILFPGVVVEEGAAVNRSIVMNGTRIAAGARVEHAILDKRVRIGERASVGGSPAAPPNSRVPDLLRGGVSLLGQDVVIEDGGRVGGNVVIGGRRRLERDGEIADGSYLEGSIPRIFEARRTSSEP